MDGLVTSPVRSVVYTPVRLGFELAAQEPPVCLSQLGGLRHHARPLVLLRSDNDLGAEHAHQLAPLYRERLGHGDDAIVPTLSAKHGDCNASVATCGFDHGVARLEQTLLLRVLHDGQREAVLHGRKRVEKLAFHVDGLAGRREAVVDLDNLQGENGYEEDRSGDDLGQTGNRAARFSECGVLTGVLPIVWVMSSNRPRPSPRMSGVVFPLNMRLAKSRRGSDNALARKTDQ